MPLTVYLIAKNNLMQKILLLSDIHLRGPDQTIIGLDPVAQFRAALDHALARHGDAAHLILLGDLTHSGRELEFERLKAITDHLPIPVTFTLGNHDNRDNFSKVFSHVRPDPSGHYQSVIDLPQHRLIVLDTLDGPPFRNDHHAGRLCADRLGWLDRQIATAAGRKILIFMHHPPMDVGFCGMDAIKLAGGDAFLDRVAPVATHLFCGHIHRTISGSAKGLGFTVFKSPCHQMPMELSGADSSYSVPEPGAYGLILLTEDGVIVHTEDFEMATHKIEPRLDALPE